MKIRGNTVGTTLSPEKALVKARNLTEEEKAQARANIGAAAEGDSPGGSGVSALIVTLSEDSIASHTPAQILAHMQNGGVVYLNPYENDLVQCAECDGYNAIFFVMYDDYTGYTYVIDENGICNQSEQNYASFHDVPTTLVVTVYEDGATADYASAQIYEHIQNGGIVYLKPYDGDYIPCSDCTEDIAYFTSVLDGYGSVSYRIFADRTVARDDQYYAKKSDIQTALPNPHALTFTGAVSATYDGSKAMSIEIPSGGGSGGSGGASGWQHIDTIDLSSGALSYEFDTTGYNEIMLVNKTAVNCAGSVVNWKSASNPLTGGNIAVNKVIGTVFMLHYLGNGTIAYSNGRQSDTLLMAGAMNVNEDTLSNTLRLTFTTVTSGTIFIAGRA